MSSELPEISTPDVVDPVLGNMKEAANETASKVKKSTEPTAQEKVDKAAKDTKGKLDSISDSINKKIDDFKEDLPKGEKKITDFLSNMYSKFVGFHSNLYRKTEVTVKENPIASSQIFLAAIGTVGVLTTLSISPNAFTSLNPCTNKRENHLLLGGVVALFGALDSLLISYLKKDESLTGQAKS